MKYYISIFFILFLTFSCYCNLQAQTLSTELTKKESPEILYEQNLKLMIDRDKRNDMKNFETLMKAGKDQELGSKISRILLDIRDLQFQNANSPQSQKQELFTILRQISERKEEIKKLLNNKELKISYLQYILAPNSKYKFYDAEEKSKFADELKKIKANKPSTFELKLDYKVVGKKAKDNKDSLYFHSLIK